MVIHENNDHKNLEVYTVCILLYLLGTPYLSLLPCRFIDSFHNQATVLLTLPTEITHWLANNYEGHKGSPVCVESRVLYVCLIARLAALNIHQPDGLMKGISKIFCVKLMLLCYIVLFSPFCCDWMLVAWYSTRQQDGIFLSVVD